MKLRLGVFFILFFFYVFNPTIVLAHREADLAERLAHIRVRVVNLEQSLVDARHTQQKAQIQTKKIKTLIKLQRQQRELGRKRLKELEKTVGELESRRGILREKISHQQKAMREFLMELDRSIREEPRTLHLPEREKIEAPRRKILAHLVDRGLKEIEEYRADLSDSDYLEAQIQEEKQQLAYFFHDLKEQESVLELNQQLHEDFLAQLENYRKLKNAEAQVEKLITEFSAHRELERVAEAEKNAAKEMAKEQSHLAFIQMKGKLHLPIEGKVISSFGRFFDSRSRLYVFKKGIDIAGKAPKSLIHAVSSGKVAYSGELPNYGRVLIIDHGEHFYSLCAHLGELSKKIGEAVAAGDPIGLSDDAGTPIYFEIRARNIAVNPLQWISN